MAERGNGARLANEAGSIVMVRGRQKLDCDAAGQVLVLGQVDDAHTALAQFFNNSIMRNCLADHARMEFLWKREKEENLAIKEGPGTRTCTLGRPKTVGALCAKRTFKFKGSVLNSGLLRLKASF